VESRLSSGVSRIAWESPHRALLAIAQQLQSEGVPLSELFGEMILASSCVDGTDPPAPAVVELLSEPMTAAESVGTLMLAKTAARARDAQLELQHPALSGVEARHVGARSACAAVSS